MYDPNMSTTPSTITTINRPEHIAQPPLQFTKTTSCAPVATSRNHEPRIIRR